MRSGPFLIMNALDGSKDEASTALPSLGIFAISAQVIVAGSSTGTLKLQFSNDPQNKQYTPDSIPTNWSDITSASSVVSGAGVTAIQKTEICANFIRAVWTHNNGSAGMVTVNLQIIGL